MNNIDSSYTEKGFVYVVNTEGYLSEALTSYASLKQAMPAAKVAIITHPDLFLSIEEIIWVPLVSSYDGPIVKVEMVRSPFLRTIYLDSDTLVLGSLDDLFELMEAFDLALAHEPTRGWDYETSAPGPFVELNTGVVVFRKSQQMEAFFADWKNRYYLMRGQKNLKNDQPSFRETLWVHRNLRHATLTTEFHLITGKGASTAWHVKLLHGRDDLPTIAATINRDLGPRTYNPGWGVVMPPRGRKYWITDYVRLTVRFWRGLLRPATLRVRPNPRRWW
jgi:hypothetical protein